MKKILSMLLVLAMSVSLFTACATEEETSGPDKSGTDAITDAPEDSSDDTAESTEPVELAEINVIYWTLNTVPTDLLKVEEAINAITEPEIGVTVHLNVMDMGTYLTQASLMVSNSEKVDLMPTFPAASAHFASMASQGMLTPLNDLLTEYCQDLVAILPEYYLNATTREGNVLAVPSYKNLVRDQYWVCRSSVLEGAGLTVEDIKTVEDIEKALIAIKEAYPDMVPLGGNAKTTNLTYPSFGPILGGYYDALGETTAVAASVSYDDATYSVVNRYETEEWKADIEVLKKWYDLGLIDKDLANSEGNAEALSDSTVASSFVVMNQAKKEQFDTTINDKLSYVKLQDGTISTGALTQMTWAIPTSATEPEAAAKYLNMLYTDERILNLMDYGLEGDHYVKNADGTIGYPEGIDATNSGYYIGMNEIIGNAFLAYPWEGSNPDSAKIGQEIMQNAKASPLLGFSLDTSPVNDIYAQLTSICNDQYRPALACGSAPAGYQDEFIKALNDAGIKDYIAEAQRQLNEWLAANK